MTLPINQIQDDIIKEFSGLNGNIEEVLFYIVALGQELPSMPEEYRIDNNLIKGCHSTVWLGAREDEKKLFFYADSDTIISKGLVSLLTRIFNGQHPEEILRADLYFIHKSRLERFIGTKRSNGFSAMINQIKFCASTKV